MEDLQSMLLSALIGLLIIVVIFYKVLNIYQNTKLKPKTIENANFTANVNELFESEHQKEDADSSCQEEESDSDSDESGLVSKIKKAKLKSYERKISLTNHERELETEMTQRQLDVIFQLLQKQNDELSKNDIQEQLNLYK